MFLILLLELVPLMKYDGEFSIVAATLNKSSAVVRISYSYPKFWQNNIISLGISKNKTE